MNANWDEIATHIKKEGYYHRLGMVGRSKTMMVQFFSLATRGFNKPGKRLEESECVIENRNIECAVT